MSVGNFVMYVGSYIGGLVTWDIQSYNKTLKMYPLFRLFVFLLFSLLSSSSSSSSSSIGL